MATAGWLGRSTKSVHFGNASALALFAKFNFRVKWFDGWENHKLLLDNYNSGPSAPFNSWVLLEKVKEAAGAGPSDTVRE